MYNIQTIPTLNLSAEDFINTYPSFIDFFINTALSLPIEEFIGWENIDYDIEDKIGSSTMSIIELRNLLFLKQRFYRHNSDLLDDKERKVIYNIIDLIKYKIIEQGQG